MLIRDSTLHVSCIAGKPWQPTLTSIGQWSLSRIAVSSVISFSRTWICSNCKVSF